MIRRNISISLMVCGALAMLVGREKKRVVRAAGRWAVQKIRSKPTALKNPTLCGLVVAQQQKCEYTGTGAPRCTH